MTVLVEKNVSIPMRDGVKLAADIYRPSSPGEYPVLLQRTPYNKEMWPITAMTLDPIRAAAAGYAVVIQDVRARWASEGGVFFPYRDEEDDGYDSIEWSSKEAYCSGQVGCYGLSNSFLPFFYEFLKHPVPDDWTASMLMSNRHEQVKVPSLTIAGWHDLLLAPDLEHFQGMRSNAGSETAREKSKLIVGPWAHASFLHVVGDIDFGFRRNGMFLDLKDDLTKLQLRWFDRWLKGEPNGIDDEAPVKLFIQGSNRWHDEQAWPLARAVDTPWFLNDEQGLSLTPPSPNTLPESYVYDPNDPCPTCGGGTLLPPQYAPGPRDQTPILNRRDVLCHTSKLLEQDLEVTRAVAAVLFAATSGRATDWVVKLCDMHPDGTTYSVCDGVLRASVRDGVTRQLVEPNAIVRYEVSLCSTAMLFKAGHRLRVLITSSDFPRYDRNPNTGELAHSATRLEPALQRIYLDAEHASHIILPVVAN